MSLKVCTEGAAANECLIQERSNILLRYKSCMSEGAGGSLLRQQLKGLILQMWGGDVQRELSLFQRDFLDPVGRGELHGSSTHSHTATACVTSVIRQWMLIACGQGRN